MTEEIHRMGSDVAELAAAIVSAYVSKNSIPVVDLPALIRSTYVALSGLEAGGMSAISEPDVEKPTSAQIRKSVRDDGIVSFLDGKTYKTLKRHLSANGLDPRSYCARYGLPADYPMVAPSYAEKRSALAKAIGLGRPGGQAEREAGKRKAA